MWWILSAIGFAFLFLDKAVNTISDITERGRRLSDSHIDARGIVTEDPVSLRAQAQSILKRDISADAYAAARMVRSEDGSASTLTKARLVGVAMNQARKLGWSVDRLIRFHTDAQRDGRFGLQITGRFASTRDPYENDLAAAELALSLGDQTEGAMNFAHRNAFGIQPGTGTFESFVATMRNEGKRGGVFPESSNLVFFWRGDVPAIAMPIDQDVA
jgi:hypothetical protein